MEMNRLSAFANLLTVGNGVCGFAAIALLLRASIPADAGGTEPPVLSPETLGLFAGAAWLMLLGMVFDVFDGKVARLAGASNPLGAQLDSLADLVTFGLAPALLMVRLAEAAAPAVPWWQRAVWFFSLAYFLGALLRLARFTAEQDADEGEHEAFKGLPTPGAAGCVASLVIFYSYIMTFRAKELQWLSQRIDPETLKQVVSHIPIGLPVLGLVLGYTMVSNRLVFAHVGTRLFARKQSFDSLVYMVFGALLLAIFPEACLPLLFLGYVVYTPSKQLLHLLLGAKGARRGHPKSADA